MKDFFNLFGLILLTIILLTAIVSGKYDKEKFLKCLDRIDKRIEQLEDQNKTYIFKVELK